MVEAYLLHGGITVIGTPVETQVVDESDFLQTSLEVRNPRIIIQQGPNQWVLVPLFGNPDRITIETVALRYEIKAAQILEKYQEATSNIKVIKQMPKGLTDGKPTPHN